jgi:hypothetical protein
LFFPSRGFLAQKTLEFLEDPIWAQPLGFFIRLFPLHFYDDSAFHDQLGWTLEQKRNDTNYHTGILVTFSLGIGTIQRGQTSEVDRVKTACFDWKGLSVW